MMPNPKMSKAKTVVAALGATAVAVATAAATVAVVLADDALDLGEYSVVVTAVLTLGATVYGVWKVPNKVLRTPRDENDGAFYE